MKPSAETPTDAELAHAARAGSAEAFERLVARHEVALYRFLLMRCGRAEVAEELLGDAVVRCWTRLHLYDVRRAFRTWLFRIAANLAANRRRDRALGGGESLEQVVDRRDPLLVAAAREQRANLWLLVQRVLPSEACSALWLCHAEGLSASVIGEVLGKSEGAVRTLLCRARARLATALRGSELSLEVR